MSATETLALLFVSGGSFASFVVSITEAEGCAYPPVAAGRPESSF